MDAVNPLSYRHVLEKILRVACVRLNLTSAYLTMRIMSNGFLDACVQVIRCGFGILAFNNDEIVIPNLLNSVLNRDA